MFSARFLMPGGGNYIKQGSNILARRAFSTPANVGTVGSAKSKLRRVATRHTFTFGEEGNESSKVFTSLGFSAGLIAIVGAVYGLTTARAEAAPSSSYSPPKEGEKVASVEGVIDLSDKYFADNYERVDEVGLKYLKFDHTNVVHSTLAIEGGISEMRVYRSKDRKKLACFVRLGGRLSGHPTILHGGVTAMLFDNVFGWGVYLLPKVPYGSKYVTANLSLNFKAPGSVDDHRYIIVCEVDKVEKDKKVFVKGEMIDVSNGKVIATSTALFIAIQKDDEEGYSMLQKVLGCIDKGVNPDDASATCVL